jgi:hypothetical protein
LSETAAESLRDQALRMVRNLAAEVESLQTGGQTPIDAVRELALSDRGKAKGKQTITASGTETRRQTRPTVRIRELSQEARRTERIMRHIGDCDPEALKALSLYADLGQLTDIAVVMKRSYTVTHGNLEAALLVFVSCLRLRY